MELRNDGDEIKVSNILAGDKWPLRILAAVTTTSAKPVSSGEAMEISRRTSPFYGRWIEQQADDLDTARAAIAERDFTKLGAIAEHNCLKMHSVMWGSRPPMIYWNSVTLDCMQTVRDLQSGGVDVFFTIDAGPQLKAVCTPAAERRVREALMATAGVRDIMVSGLGLGATIVTDG